MINSHPFLDSDGVFADFEGGFHARFGRYFATTPVGVAWNLIYKTPDFYATLPLMPGARELWDVVQGRNPTVLTGCPTAGRAQAETAKRFWWAENFGKDVKVITCARKDKPLHMINPGDLLLDDHQKNIDPWVAAGGVGILYTRHTSAIPLVEAHFRAVDELREQAKNNDI